MPPRETLSPEAAREQELRRELQRAYESLTEITSRVLLASEAAEAALSSHQRTELSERFLRVAVRAAEVRRAALFLVEPDGFSVGATVGLADAEQEALAGNTADVESCQSAVDSAAPVVLDSTLVAEEELEAVLALGAEAEDEAGEAEEEEEAEEEAEVAEEEAEEEADEEEGSEGPPTFGIYFAVRLEEAPVAVLALGERAGGRTYRRDDFVFLRHLLGQYAVALNRSVLIEQNENRLRELDALLRVSREITSTLDLDTVLRAVVNTVAAVVPNDRAEIALLKGGRLKLQAVSGMTRLHPDQAELFKLEGPLEFLLLKPGRLQVSADDLGEGPGAKVFDQYVSNQEMRSFMALPLQDDQGLLGYLCLESRQDAWDVQPAEGDALDIVRAQTTVAIRNAMLYSQIPLRGVARPMFHLRSRLEALGARRRGLAWAAGAGLLLVLLLPIFPDRAAGPAEIRPLHLRGVRALTEGVVSRALVRGGESVAAGQPLAVLEDLDLAGRLAQLRASLDVTAREIAAARQAGDDAGWRGGQIRFAALQSTLQFEEQRSRATVLSAPFAGQVLELNLDQQVGRHLAAGESFCTVASLDSMRAEILVSEVRVGRLAMGQPVAVKVEAFPTRTFSGRVEEVGWRGNPDPHGIPLFAVHAAIANPGHLLRPGMSGIGRARVGRRPLAALALEPIVRAIQLGWW